MESFFSAEETWRHDLSACTRNILHTVAGSSGIWKNKISMLWRRAYGWLAQTFSWVSQHMREWKLGQAQIPVARIPKHPTWQTFCSCHSGVTVCTSMSAPRRAVHTSLRPNSRNPTWAERDTVVRPAAQLEHILLISHHVANYRSRGQHSVGHWSFWPFSHDPCLPHVITAAQLEAGWSSAASLPRECPDTHLEEKKVGKEGARSPLRAVMFD